MMPAFVKFPQLLDVCYALKDQKTDPTNWNKLKDIVDFKERGWAYFPDNNHAQLEFKLNWMPEVP